MRKTARELGKGVLVSGQEINKRLIRNGFMIKTSIGYELTNKGRWFGTEVVKMKKNHYEFKNIEWDERVIIYLFTDEELGNAIRRKALRSFKENTK